jgi:hypothetical protein
MSITFTQIHQSTNNFNAGTIPIDVTFTGNLLAVECSTKPEYATTQQTVGYLYQFNGNVQKAYAIKSGKDVIRLELPETTRMMFLPTSYLSDNYTLTLGYTNVGTVIDGSNSVSVPEELLALPARATDTEQNIENISTILDGLDLVDTALDGRLTTLEGSISSPLWTDITGKPTSFSPSSHSHVIADTTGLPEDLTALSAGLALLASDLGDLAERVETLEGAAPVTGNSLAITPLVVNTTLESNKSYLATAANLVCTLPSAPSIGDIVTLSTGNFSLKVNHGNSLQQVLNNNTLSTVGGLNGIILKAYADISLVFLGANLWKTTYRARVVSNWLQDMPLTLTRASDGDTNGYFHYVGTRGGAFSNPVPSLILGLQSSLLDAPRNIEKLTDRALSEIHTLDQASSWVGWKLHAQLAISSYTLRQRNQAAERMLRQWVLEGSNSVGADTIAGFNAATWTAIDTRNDATWIPQNTYKNFVVTGALPYQYIRLRQTGTNSNGDNFLCLGEVELYGSTVSYGVNEVTV